MGRKKTVKLADKLAAIRSKKEDDKNKADFEAQDTLKKKMPKKLKNYPSWKADLEAFKDGGKMKKQGYDDREDERLGMEHGKISSKDFVGTKSEKEHSRRDDAEFEERDLGGYMADGGKVNFAVDKIREIMEEAEYRLAGGREEGQVWNYINESLQVIIKSKENRDELTDKVYNIVAKRVGADTIGHDEKAGGGYAEDGRLIYKTAEFEEIDSAIEKIRRNAFVFRVKGVVKLVNKYLDEIEELVNTYGTEWKSKMKDGGYMKEGGATDTEKDIIKKYENKIKESSEKDIERATKEKETELVEMYRNDLSNHQDVIDAMYNGHWQPALNMWRRMDTASRDNITNEAYELLMEKNNLPTYKDGGYMAKGGALEHGLKVGDQVHSMRENYIGVYNEKEDEYGTIDISKGERKIVDMYRPKDQSKKEYGGYAEDGEYMAAGGQLKKWKVTYITRDGKNGVKEITLGAKSESQDVMNAIKRMYDNDIREVTSVREISEDGAYMAGGGKLKKAQISRQNPFPEGGTSFKNIYIKASPKDMHEALGEPSRRGSADDKVQYSWIYEHNGKIVTIYDYKENTLSKTSSKKIDWHVGGNNTDAAQEVADIIKEKLGISTKKPTYEELYEKVYGTKPDFKMMHGGETHRADNK